MGERDDAHDLVQKGGAKIQGGRPMTQRFALRRRDFGLALASAAALRTPAFADVSGGRWIGTWAASPQPVWQPDFFLPVAIPRGLLNQTVRQVARVSLGGNRVRIVLSNEYGDRPLAVGAARIGRAEPEGGVVPGSDRALTFAGSASVVVPPGAPVTSDPVDMAVPALGELAISVFFPGVTPVTTWHGDAVQTAYISKPEGDLTGSPRFTAAQTALSRLFLSEIHVEARPGARAVVMFGDSITDGNSSTPDTNRRWPDFLAQRLAEAQQPVAVLNQGISGARVLRDRMGDNALARFDRDVLTTPYATSVVSMIGINDIGWPGTILVPDGEPAPSVEQIVAGYRQLIDRAHDHGLRILGATLTPFEGALEPTPIRGYFTEAKEAKRVEVNQWIRTSGAFDGVIDFDAATRDPANPRRIQAAFDSGDHLHPNDAGYRAMAAAVDLRALLGA